MIVSCCAQTATVDPGPSCNAAGLPPGDQLTTAGWSESFGGPPGVLLLLRALGLIFGMEVSLRRAALILSEAPSKFAATHGLDILILPLPLVQARTFATSNCAESDSESVIFLIRN